MGNSHKNYIVFPLILIVNCLAYFWSSGEFPVPACRWNMCFGLFKLPTHDSIRGRARPLHLYRLWSPEVNLVYIHVHAPILYMLYTHACVYIHFHYLVTSRICVVSLQSRGYHVSLVYTSTYLLILFLTPWLFFTRGILRMGVFYVYYYYFFWLLYYLL